MRLFPRAKHLAVGDNAPSFRVTDQDGKSHGFSDYRGRPVVILFYPKDGTPGCARELRGIQDNLERFERAGVVVVGCSMDDATTHKRWAEKEGFGFPLLADDQGLLARAFGVHRKLGPFTRARRATFVIGPNGLVAKVLDEVDTTRHAAEVLKVLETLGFVKA